MTILSPFSEGQLAQSIGEGVEGERRLLEDLGGRLKRTMGPVLGFLLAGRELVLSNAVLVVLGPDAAAAADLDLEPLAEGDSRRDCRRRAGRRSLVAECSNLPRMQHRQHNLRRRLPLPCGCPGIPPVVAPEHEPLECRMTLMLSQ